MDLEILRRIKWTTDYCIRFRICYLEVDTEFTRQLILFSSGIWYMWHYVVISISEHVFHHPTEPKAICNVFLYIIQACFHLMKESTRAFSSW